MVSRRVKSWLQDVATYEEFCYRLETKYHARGHMAIARVLSFLVMC